MAGIFQYPQAGSNLCNFMQGMEQERVLVLSVPSSRVEPLQPAIRAEDECGCEHFQYPQAGSNLCNAIKDRIDVRWQQLSVPSSRVEPLQR